MVIQMEIIKYSPYDEQKQKQMQHHYNGEIKWN